MGSVLLVLPQAPWLPFRDLCISLATSTKLCLHWMPWLPLLPEAMSVAVNRITDRHSLLRNLLQVSSEMMSSVCLAGKVNSFLFCSKSLGDKEPGRQVAHRLLGAGFTKVTMVSLLIGHCTFWLCVLCIVGPMTAGPPRLGGCCSMWSFSSASSSAWKLNTEIPTMLPGLPQVLLSGQRWTTVSILSFMV
jgi:hypothetical protein